MVFLNNLFIILEEQKWNDMMEDSTSSHVYFLLPLYCIVFIPYMLHSIRYPAVAGYPAGYLVSGFNICRISCRPDIQLIQYPAHTQF